MRPNFRTITNRIPEKPLWFDHEGTPRYDAFRPSNLGVYDQWAVLCEIACQLCHTRFQVGAGWSRMEDYQNYLTELGFWYTMPTEKAGAMPSDHDTTLESLVHNYFYGDPPSHRDHMGNICAGVTMSSTSLRVLEAWERSTFNGWIRYPELEG